MRRVALRFLVYALAVTALTALTVFWGATSPHGFGLERQFAGSDAQTSELSPIELMQNVLLLYGVTLLVIIALKDRLRRPMAWSLAILLLAFLVRELDFFLDHLIADNVWQVLSALLLAIGIVYGVRQRVRWRQGFRRSWPSAGLAIFLAGVIMLLSFAQLLGNEIIWRTILGDAYIRVIKTAVEEYCELGAYMLMAIGLSEFFYAWSLLPRGSARRH